MIRLTETQSRLLVESLESAPYPTPFMTEIIGSLRDQISHPRFYNDLIDTIINLIMTPTSRSSVPNSLVQALQSAVLSPTELAKTKALLKNYQLCSHCYKKISDREIANAIEGKLYCWSCVPCEVISCRSCERLIELPYNTISKAIKKVVGACDCKKSVDARSSIDETLSGAVVGNDIRPVTRTTPAHRAVPFNGEPIGAVGQWARNGSITAEPPVRSSDEIFFTTTNAAPSRVVQWDPVPIIRDEGLQSASPNTTSTQSIYDLNQMYPAQSPDEGPESEMLPEDLDLLTGPPDED